MTGSILAYLQNRAMEFGPLAEEAAEPERSWRHWKLARDENDIVWLFFDMKDTSVNVLSQEAISELGEVIKHLESEVPKGLVIRSAKSSGFCAGADIEEFQGLNDKEEIISKLQKAHDIVDQLAALPYPTVALIHGSCLGGGLEVALCCDYRLALPDTKLGFPEILLGLHPGLGGTARLTHLIDPIEAMTLMLTGKTLDARRAKKKGLVDAIIEERHIINAIRAAVDGKLKAHEGGFKERLLTTGPARQYEARQMRAKSAEKAPSEHYPAPEALIQLWERHGGDTQEMREAEIRSFADLLTSDTAQNLIRVFFLSEKMKKLAKTSDHKIHQVHVIGAGAMGGDIAGWCAFQGLRVTLHDPESNTIADAVRRASDLCEKKHRSASETREVLDRLIPDPDNLGVTKADLVIEAVPEKLDIKHQVYKEIEPRMKKGALLATNTSSIPLKELVSVLKKPGNFIGLHFFNPVAKMQLVEVVDQARATKSTRAQANAFVGQINRYPAPVKSAPGFLVNRVLMPYLLEAILLLDEGVAAETIDRAAENFGMPMGPVELADHVGLDICLDVAEMLTERLDQTLPELPDWFRKQVENGDLGRKSGQGFYVWENGKPKKEKETEEPGEDLLDRLLMPMLNTCMTCLRKEIIDDEDLLDAAIIFGTGFAPFRGGPLHYAKNQGKEKIVARMEGFAEKYGERFKPDSGWAEFL
jgi:3-hydroxyacyl-CoA dehydrogenase/enoyl-CoA hydratase/3-hydroxybutyryl-CoA epimerase